jgi:RNase adapter protein RapZ
MYEREGKSYLTIAVGCTGGRHRSVTIAQKFFESLKLENREVTLKHRDMDLAG